MSEFRVNTISDAAGTGPVTLTGQSAAKAWVNFNGTGTIATRDSFNVASLTDDGTGIYTVNYSNAMANEGNAISGSGNDLVSNLILATRDVNTTDIKVRMTNTSATGDNAQVHVKTHGDLA